MNYMLAADEIYKLAKKAYYLPIYPDPRFPPSLYYRFFELLTEWWKPGMSVELGLCGGGCSLHMVLGYPDGIVLGVDFTDDYPDNRKHLEATCENFKFLHMDSITAAEEYQVLYPDIYVDILFIDTNHTYEHTMAEYNAWFPNLNGNAIIVLDDLHRLGMMKAWYEIPGHHILLDELHVGDTPTDGGFGCILI